MIDYKTTFVNTDGVNFPNTAAVNATSPGAKDGTEFIKAFIDDFWGASQALMDEVGFTPDGNPEAAGASQRLDALKALITETISLNTVVITASGSYVKPSNLIAVEVEIVAGGGSSGGVSATGVGENAVSGGGGGGGYSKKLILAASLLASETVTIGAAGTAPAAGAAGNAGGNTTFGAHLTANGGPGGPLGNDTVGDEFNTVIGGTATGGDINVSGGKSTYGIVSAGSRVSLSDGGDSEFGRGGSATNNGVGLVGTGFGSGGGGSSSGISQAARAGIDGRPGICIIKEYLGA